MSNNPQQANFTTFQCILCTTYQALPDQIQSQLCLLPRFGLNPNKIFDCLLFLYSSHQSLLERYEPQRMLQPVTDFKHDPPGGHSDSGVNQNFFYDNLNSCVYYVSQDDHKLHCLRLSGASSNSKVASEKQAQQQQQSKVTEGSLDAVIKSAQFHCFDSAISTGNNSKQSTEWQPIPRLKNVQLSSSSQQGQAILNLDRTIAVAKDNSQTTVQSDKSLLEGMSWSWYIPTSLSEVKVGLVVCSGSGINSNDSNSANSSSLEFDCFELKSSTARTVTCRVRLSDEQLVVNVWVNGIKPVKCHERKLRKNCLYYPAVSFDQKGLSAVFSPFAVVPNQKVQYTQSEESIKNVIEGRVESKETEREIKLESVVQLSQDKMLLVGSIQTEGPNSSSSQVVKVLHRSSRTQSFVFQSVYVSSSGCVKNIMRPDLLLKLQKDPSLAEMWVDFKDSSSMEFGPFLKVLGASIAQLQKENRQNDSDNIYKELLSMLLIIRNQLRADTPSPKGSLPARTSLCSNAIYQSELDRIPYRQSLKYFENQSQNYSQSQFSVSPSQIPANNVSKEQVLNACASTWRKVDGKIMQVTDNYLLSVDDETVIIYFIGGYESFSGGVRQVFRENMVFLEFGPKSNFLEKFDQNLLKTLSSNHQGSSSSSIYKILLSNTLSKGESAIHKDGTVDLTRDELYEVKKSDLQEMTNDYRIEESEARKSLEQTGSVDEALVWLANSEEDRKYIKVRKTYESPKKRQAELSNADSLKCSILELSQKNTVAFKRCNFAPLLLHCNATIYVLGLSPKEISQNLIKTQKQFVNLYDFKREFSIEQLDTQSWFLNGNNHKKLHILDCGQVLNKETNENFDFLFRSFETVTDNSDSLVEKIYACKNEEEILMRTEISLEMSKTYTNDCVFGTQEKIKEYSFTPFDTFIDMKEAVRTLRGQFLFGDTEELLKDKRISQVSILHKGKLLSNLSPSEKQTKRLRVRATINPEEYSKRITVKNGIKSDSKSSSSQAEFVPLLIQKGPPGCNMQYPICSILYPKSAFLANYPHEIKFRNLHSNYMNISSVIIERLSKRKNVNTAKGGLIYFEAQSGLRSKVYKFSFDQSDGESKEVSVSENGYWKYLIIEPIYSEDASGKRTMPYEIGFFGAKGTVIEENVYRNLMEKELKKSMSKEIFASKELSVGEVDTLTETTPSSGGVLLIDFKISSQTSQLEELLQKSLSGLKSSKSRLIDRVLDWSLSNVLSESSYVQKGQTSTSNDKRQIRQLQKLSQKEINKLMLKKQNRVEILKQFVKNDELSFDSWVADEIRKFMDLVYMQADSLKEESFKVLFDKLVSNPEGKKYLMETSEGLGKCYVAFPKNYLPYLMQKIEPLQHRQNLKDLLKSLDKYRSEKYAELRKQKNPYLLYEHQFYSRYYLDAVEKMQMSCSLPEEEKVEIYQESPFIPCQFASIKDEFSRKIFVKLENGVHVIKQMTLRFDKTEVESRVNYKVLAFSSSQEKMVEISNGRIETHQFIQVSRTSQKIEMKDMFKQRSNQLNAVGLDLKKNLIQRGREQLTCTQYLEIQLIFNETGLVSYDNQSILPFIDIVPEIYGDKANSNSGSSDGKTTGSSKISQQTASPIAQNIEKYFTYTDEEKFLLSNVEIGLEPLEKYSITKENEFEYSLFKPIVDRLDVLQQNLDQKLSENDLVGALPIHKKLVKAFNKKAAKDSHKPNLDYVFTLLMYTLEQIFSNKIKISEQTCHELFEKIIKQEIGPIRISAFKAASHSISYLVKSLPYIEEEDERNLPSLDQVTFDQNQLEPNVDLTNVPLCKSMNKLIVKSIPYKTEWGTLAAKLCAVTNMWEETTMYILQKGNSKFEGKWLQSMVLVEFLCKLPENALKSVFLKHVTKENLDRLILLCKESQVVTQRLEILINQLLAKCLEKQSMGSAKISLDIVSIMLEQKDIKWNNLYKVIKMCPEAQDLILNQYLQVALHKPAYLAEAYPEILNHASRLPKHSENLASFFGRLFAENRSAFKRAVVGLPEEEDGKYVSMHSDMYEILAYYLYEQCNFGGVEGSKMLSDSEVYSLHVAQILLKRLSHSLNSDESIGSAVQQNSPTYEQILTEWYFCNNSYELKSGNPANRSPGSLLMKTISEKILPLLKRVDINKVLRVFDRLLDQIQKEQIPLSTKHLYVNQINEGVKKLLSTSIVNSDTLTRILIPVSSQGSNEANKMLHKIFSTLEKNAEKTSAKSTITSAALNAQKWTKCNEIDVTNKLQISTPSNGQEKIKDIEANRAGSKSSLFKVPLKDKKVLLKVVKSENDDIDSSEQLNSNEKNPSQSAILSKFIIGFQALDTVEKNNVFPFGVQLFGGETEDNLSRLCELTEIRDQHFQSFNTRVYGVNFNSMSMRKNIWPMGNFELRLRESVPATVSEILQSSQKSKKNAFYSVSFMMASAYELQPETEPEYSQIYMTLLSFLSQPKYSKTLRNVIDSAYYHQHSKNIIKTLNSMLPNEEMEGLLLALNNQNQDILSVILQESVSPNLKLVRSLVEKNPSKENIKKLLNYFISNCKEALKIANNEFSKQKAAFASFNSSRDTIRKQISEILVEIICLYGYGLWSNSEKNQKLDRKIDFNVQELIQLFTVAVNKSDSTVFSRIFDVLCCILSRMNVFSFDYSKTVQNLWSQALTENRWENLSLIGATICNYTPELNNFLDTGKTQRVCQQLLKEMEAIKHQEERSSEAPSSQGSVSKVSNLIYLLSCLSTHLKHREFLSQRNIPIQIVELLKSGQSVINKRYSQAGVVESSNRQSVRSVLPQPLMKYFILLFQSTCIGTECEDKFSEILIELMVRLPEVSEHHHKFFIHEFFFPLINAVSGVAVKFVYRKGQTLYKYVTESLKVKPIKSLSSDFFDQKNNLYYQKCETKQNSFSSVLEDLTALQNQSSQIDVNGRSVIKGEANTDFIIVRRSKENTSGVSKEPSIKRELFARINSSTKECMIVKGGQDSNSGVERVKYEVNNTNSNRQFVIKTQPQQIVISSQESAENSADSNYELYRENTHEIRNLLTNQVLINTVKHDKNSGSGIFGDKYLSTMPLQDSTFEKVYLIPSEMSVMDLLKQINISGLRLNQEALKATSILRFKDQKALSTDKPISELLDLEGEKHLLTLEINPQNLFQNASIEELQKQTGQNAQSAPLFIPQQTIFKSFEQKQGLIQMIKVLQTCVKNWNNKVQTQVWQQYLNELLSYSAFPVFSSIYMNKQENVKLLFDILSGSPDKEDSAKWIEIEKASVKELYEIVKEVFEVEGEKALEIRRFAIENNFYKTMLDRLHLVSKEPKRYKAVNAQEDNLDQEIDMVPGQLPKKDSQDEYKLKVVKKKGIGYGTDSSSNQKWDVNEKEETKKEMAAQILGLLSILQKFIDHSSFEIPPQMVEQTYESALLPIIESSLRGGSLLQISKTADLFRGQLSLVKVFARKRQLIPVLMNIPKQYEPKQHESVEQLLKVLEGTAKIFISCLTGSANEKLSEEIAKETIETYSIVSEAINSFNIDNVDEDADKKIMELPLVKKYPLLLKDLRFDYVDMKDSKSGKITKHHYSSHYVANHKPPATKTIRLAQELADISHALPVEHTNAIYVRCDKERVDFMQALIMGSNGTPYGHGAFLFDIYFDDTYPNNPPKVNLTTTGSGQIRFNPNLYNCGKVCLSLLGTWRGSAMENWDPKISTLLQILLSIQSIIMSEEVYFNEPGFEHEQGTVEGEKKNQAYANVVRHGNIKFAMTENLKNPPKGFEHVIRRHFYLKKEEILENCQKWLKYAEKREASYNGLVSDHNHNWCNQFKKSKDQYRKSLQKAIKELQVELNKLQEPSSKDLKPISGDSSKQQQTNSEGNLSKKHKMKTIVESKDENLDDVDVTYQKNETISTTNAKYKELDINDEKVKDRWSRYIGAMGIEAVSKQAKASIALFGLGAVGVQIAKNIILSGCKKISIRDDRKVSIEMLSGQFFLQEQDLGKGVLESCHYKLQELNHYVRVEELKIQKGSTQQSESSYSAEQLEILKDYDVVILTEQSLADQKAVSQFCHSHGVKFIITDCYGPFGQHFNDFGSEFEVLDKNGEETVEVMIENITNAETGVVTLIKGQRHPYEDGDVVRITGVKGMHAQNQDPVADTQENNMQEKVKEEGQQQEDQNHSINGTMHKIKVLNPNSFEIGDTTIYSVYEGDGLARNMKIPRKVQFKSFNDSISACISDSGSVDVDENLTYYDFEKGGENNQIIHKCFLVLSFFRQKHEGKYPRAWNWEDCLQFVGIFKEKFSKVWSELKTPQINLIRKFSFTCSGTFAPLCAFFGGLTAQQTFKAITGKYMPISQYFLIEFSEVVPELPQKNKLEVKSAQIGQNEEKKAETQQQAKENKEPQPTFQQVEELVKNFVAQQMQYKEDDTDRFEGLRRVIGSKTHQLLQKCKVFLIGSGAIGCELLKNYAMINLGTSKEKGCGEIIVTDPDHIEQSNLNRQFLFREKHLRKSKSATAAAAVMQMNKLLKGKIRAKLDRVCESTKDIFSNEFFESLTLVTNALDNVKARQYVDQRCVENKVALLQSGTLSSKGHVQVILPYKTQTYGQQNDPAEDGGEIPHCTLKMFPQETLHCVEWARDIFGKTFTLDPKALSKLVDNWLVKKTYTPQSSDLAMLKSCLNMLESRPKDFEEATFIATNKFFQYFRNDIKQLLYTYPLDAKTKDGKPFWKLPKRPPTPIEKIEPANELHNTFIVSYAVLLCKVFGVKYPINFRTAECREKVAKEASNYEIQEFVPNDKLAQEMAEQVDKNDEGKNENENEAPKEEEFIDENQLFEKIKGHLQTMTKQISESDKKPNSPPQQIKITAEQFEKDDDKNGHIDLIYSMANLRSTNYKLDAMDWMTTKLKAGRITPALSTTTSCVAALQTIELIKYLKKCELDKMRNTFINLAVPMVQAGEPGEVEKVKIHDGLVTNIWERWSVELEGFHGEKGDNKGQKKCTLQDLIHSIEKKYGIQVKILSILEGDQIFSDLVLGLESKKEERKLQLGRTLRDFLSGEYTEEELEKLEFVDLTLVFSVKDELAKHVPTLRVSLL